MIKAIIFDYDGVIVDSFHHVYEVYKVICQELSIPCPESLVEFRRIYGYNSKECNKNLGIKDYGKASKIFKREILKRNVKIFPGIKEVLRKLSKKYKLILISSAYKEEVIQKLERFSISNNFSDIIGKMEYEKRLNKTESIIKTIEKIGIKKDEVVLIGDRDVDYEEGRKAGLKYVILVEYGWGYDKEKISQKTIIKKPEDILKAVITIN
tara:strand:- start:65 stop:694 length:630 start_codon:yes stop_codon:yes gene_type:complete